MNREDILFKIILEKKENDFQKFTLIINKKVPNKELMLLKKENMEGAKKYYPEKEFEILVEEESLKTNLEQLKEMNLTDYDVVFLDYLNFQDFHISFEYLKKYTGVRSIVIDSISRSEESTETKKVVDRVKEKIENSETFYELDPFDELLLGKNIEEITTYAQEKNISLKIA